VSWPKIVVEKNKIVIIRREKIYFNKSPLKICNLRTNIAEYWKAVQVEYYWLAVYYLALLKVLGF
jgi:hypothetical protein